MISVIVPTLNEAQSIGPCLRSLSRQSLDRRDYEVIVVDGGSSDGTVSIAQGLADRVIMQRGRGIGGARRDGALAAVGEILAFTDADTNVSYCWLEEVQLNLKRYQASTGPVMYIQPDIKAELLRRWRDLYRILNPLNFYYMIGSNMGVRADAYRRIGGHSDISLLDDYDLSVRLFREGARVTYDPRQVVYTSSRRAERLVAYSLLVAYGHYNYLLSDRGRLLNYPKSEDMCWRTVLPYGHRFHPGHTVRTCLDRAIRRIP